MKKIPPQHKRLIFATFVLMLIFIAAFFLLINPLRKKVVEDEKYIENTTRELHKSGFPLDPGRLAATLQNKKNELDGYGNSEKNSGIRYKTYSAIKFACTPLQNRAKKLFDNPADFARDVGRLDYQEEYNQLEQKLASRGIFLSDKILKLGEKSNAKDIYLLLLQVWMLDKISSIAIESGLRIQSEFSVVAQDEAGRKRMAAKMQFQPVIEYKIYESDANPYLIEIPLKVAFYGDTRKFIAFLSKIQEQSNFFVIRAFQLSLLPQIRKTETEISLVSENLSIELECSGFFSPKEISETKKPTPVKIIPPGA
ncbi:MAG TPA: hypothetical protein P5270_05695 [Victivallales bacterium]|nr:hypothetical protein [Victivallales bacterium]